MADYVRPATAQEAVLAELRARILAGAIPAGSALRQEELAAQLAVSRVPVREALRMLAAEGHVAYTPHRGYRVVKLRIGDLEEIYHLRDVIETDLVRRAAAHRSDEDLRAIRAAFDDLALLEGDGRADPVDLAAANRRFHWAVLRPAPRTERILVTLWDASEPYRAHWFARPENVARGADGHALAMAAVQARDTEALVRVLAEHRAAALSALRGALSD